jgi:hypothetical protein
MPVDVEDNNDFLKITINERQLPTIGANGFLIRREALMLTSVDNYLFDIDIIYELALKGKNKYAKVKTGIVHIFAEDMGTFIRKQQRRISDFLFFRDQNLRSYPWGKFDKSNIARFALYTVLTFPLIYQLVHGYRRMPDNAWWFHIAACWITLFAYSYGVFATFELTRSLNRSKWGL